MGNEGASRRGFLGLTGAALTGGLTLSQVGDALEGNEVENSFGGTKPEEAQSRGGAMNQGYKPAEYSGIGVKQVHSVDENPADHATIVGPGGKAASVRYDEERDDKSKVTFFDIETQEVTGQAEIPPGADYGVWHEDNYIIGTLEGLQKIQADGTIIKSNDEVAIGDAKKAGDTLYTSSPNGFAEINLNNIDDYEEHESVATPYPGGLTAIDDGDHIAMHAIDAISYDTEQDKHIDKKYIESMNTSISTDGEYIFGTTGDSMIAIDIPRGEGEELNVIDEAEFGVIAESPSVVVDGEDGKSIYNGSAFEGDKTTSIFGYEFSDGNLELDWSEPVEGKVNEIIGVGDSLIVGADKLYGLDRHTGEKIWEEDINGIPGMPHDRYIPVATSDGTYVLEMEVGEVPSQETTTTTTTTQEPTTTDTPEPTTTETPEPTTTTTSEPTTTETTTDTPTTTSEPTPTTTAEPSTPTTDTPNDNTTSTSTQDPSTRTNDTGDGDGPGFGVLTGLAGAGAAGALGAKKLLENDEE